MNRTEAAWWTLVTAAVVLGIGLIVTASILIATGPKPHPQPHLKPVHITCQVIERNGQLYANDCTYTYGR